MKINRLPKISYYRKRGIPVSSARGVGNFSLGDKVKWFTHIGYVVEVVRCGMYPQERRKGLRVYGYYREYESYIVMDSKGKHYWPRVGNLTLLEKKDGTCNIPR